MRSLLRLFWEVCLLRKGPQDMPWSRELLGALLVVGYMLDFLRLGLADTGMRLGGVALFALAALGFNLLSLGGLLWLLGYRARIVQTLIAFFGSLALIGLIELPWVLVYHFFPLFSQGLALLFQLLVVWYLLVTMHILRHALTINPVLAGVLTLGYFLLSVLFYDVLAKGLI